MLAVRPHPACRYSCSEQGERAGQRASEERRSQSLEGKRGKRIPDPHGRQGRACGMHGQVKRLGGGRRARRIVCRLGWKWRKRSSVKITERAREEDTKAVHRGREGRHFEAAFACGFRRCRSLIPN